MESGIGCKILKEHAGDMSKLFFFLARMIIWLPSPVFGYSAITDVFKARDIASRMGERICALREIGFSEQQAIRKGIEPMLKELSNTKLVGSMAKNAFRDALQEATDKCGITMK